MAQFVILRHDSPRGVHFDFMLESGGVLKTWALPRPPDSGVEMECEALADHRLAYLDYEGSVSGGRGSVTRWAYGEYTTKQQSEAEWLLDLAGEKINGQATIRRIANVASRWVFSFHESQYG